ncbi:MAG: hypothetical protein CMP51_00115 [Flavobacteriales bacterium]|nr:hypothetical protein [Flavobacteriales bacterium]
MNKSKSILLILLLTCSFNIFSYHPCSKDEYEIRYINESIHLNEATQYNLRNTSSWIEFANNNPNWYVYFNEYNQKPHRAFGSPIENSVSLDIEASSMNYINNDLSVFSLSTVQLSEPYITTNVKYNSISYSQKFKGLDVLDSRLYMKMNKQNQLLLFGLDVFSDIEISIIPNITPIQALEFAIQNIAFPIYDQEIKNELKVLPIPKDGVYQYHLIYVINFSTNNHIGPANYICYVDAHNGDLLMRRNEIKFELPQNPIHVGGDVYTTNPFNPSSNEDLVDLKLGYNGINYYTDQNGDVTLPSNNGNVTLYLEGLYTKVQTNNVTPNVTLPVSSQSHDFDNSNSSISERTAFVAVNKIHSHFKNYFPNFTGLDFSMETNVDITTSTCNAFYGGGTINFYDEGGGCNASAKIPDVAYHEYGHAINDYRYNNFGMWNGGLNEGTADIWALSLTQYPVLGEGWLLNDPNSNVREYDSVVKVYPQDLVGEVHADGEIICGAFWDTYMNLGDMNQAMNLFVSIYDNGPDGPDGSEGIIYTDVLLEFLYADDNDGNIFNGTPNDLAIVDAFAKHGITLLSNANLNHNEIHSSSHNTMIDIDASITMTYPWALENAYCFYKINNSQSWDSIPLSVISGNDYLAQIPSQSSGTVIGYYLSLVDVYGKKSAITPFSSHLLEHPNIPFHILVGYELQNEEDFDFNITFWDVSDQSDNATTGQWEIGVPEGTYYDGTVPVQPSYQNTLGGSYCAFTGNDLTGGTIGSNDVDGGHTTLTSPVYDLTDYNNPTFSYYRWYTNSPPTGANPGADWWQVLVTDDGVNWVYVENNISSDNSWRKFAFRVKDYVNISDDFRIRFIASDSIRTGQYLDGGSLVEAAVDDVYLYDALFASNVNSEVINTVEVYPNPALAQVNITNIDFACEIKVVNSLGDIVLEKNVENIKGTLSLDVSHLSQGIYFIKIQAREFVSSTKILIE